MLTKIPDMLSCQYSQNVIDGKKQIILNPGEQQRRDVASVTFGENEIYGIDILVVSAPDGKVSAVASFLTAVSLITACRVAQKIPDARFINGQPM